VQALPSLSTIIAGPDGNLWFTDDFNNSIGMIDPTTHAITEYTIATAPGSPAALMVEPDGNLWFSELGSVSTFAPPPLTLVVFNYTGAIAMISPTTHAITQVLNLGTNDVPYGFTAGPDGNLWFLTLTAEEIDQIILPPAAQPQTLGTAVGINSHKGLTGVALTFDEALSPASAEKAKLYRVLGAVQKEGETVYNKRLHVKRVRYNPTTHSVTINLARPYKGAVQVTVHKGLVASNHGRSTGGISLIAE
jgi:hypothetical protein